LIFAGLFLSGCASAPTAMRINGDVIARGTPVVVTWSGPLDDHEKIALDRKLSLFGFVPVRNGTSPYSVLVRYDSAGTVAVIELLKDGVPLLVAQSGSDWYTHRRIADFALEQPALPPAEFYQSKAAFYTALSGFEKAWYHYSSPAANGSS
jgi:hypothetical protein